MKEIKFRAWDKDNKLMLPVERIEYNRGEAMHVYVFVPECRKLNNKQHNNIYSIEECLQHYGEENIIKIIIKKDGDIIIPVMQFTGLKDKNKKEIYEGDVLKSHGQVIWNDEEYRWSCIDLNWNDKKEIHDIDYLTLPFEIIGNIYENPNLLK